MHEGEAGDQPARQAQSTLQRKRLGAWESLQIHYAVSHWRFLRQLRACVWGSWRLAGVTLPWAGRQAGMESYQNLVKLEVSPPLRGSGLGSDDRRRVPLSERGPGVGGREGGKQCRGAL